MKNQVTITYAAKLAGVTRQTVSRKISDGLLSKNSDGKIDISELLRVYPNIKITDEQGDTESNAKPSKFNANLQLKTQLLEQENNHLKQRIDDLKQRIDDLQKQLTEARSDKADLTAILKQQTATLPDYSNKRTNSWWKRIRGEK